MLNYEVYTAKCYTTKEYTLLIDFFEENYYHILEELVQMSEANATRAELQKQITLLDTFQDIQNQLECYRDSEILNEGESDEKDMHND